MITNFEDHTKDLSEDQMLLNPVVMECLKLCVKHTLSGDVCLMIQMMQHKRTGEQIPFSSVQLRKHVNYIRRKGLLPVIATSKGYYVTYDKEEIQKQINSSFERAHSIIESAEGLKRFL
jgi:hypothetical protein